MSCSSVICFNLTIRGRSMNYSRPKLSSVQILCCVLLSFAVFFGLQVVFTSLLSFQHRLWIQTTSAVVATLLSPFIYSSLLRASAAYDPDNDELDFRGAAENSIDDMYIFSGIPDSSGNIVDFRFAYINPMAERRLGSPRETLLGRSLSEVRPFAVSSGLIQRYQQVVRTGVPYTGEVFLDDDRIRSTWLHVHAVKLGNGLAITSRDVTERRRVTDQASFLANHDQLTGLANRKLLQMRLEAAIRHAEQEKNKVAVFMVDVDNFKQINDSLGHAIGDTVLKVIAKRLTMSVRDTDTVARVGGDEFVIVLPKFKEIGDIERCGEKIVKAVGKPITLDDEKINITISAGFCLYPDSGLQASDLLRNADAAMYAVKGTGRNGLRFFDEAVHTSPKG
jgi:diguanylate cyclase (GGDEF)-like protein